MFFGYWNVTTRLRSANFALAIVVVLYIIFAALSAHAQILTLLYSFNGGTDGRSPIAGLSRDAAGNFYGTTVFGGAFDDGTVFRLDASGVENVLYSFDGGSGDGNGPRGGLGRDAAGNLYGPTVLGGESNNGTVYKVDTNGNEMVLYGFAGPPTDGSAPSADLIRDRAGNLYGTTLVGGKSNNGTVYKLDTNGVESVLYSFAGTPDGSIPAGDLVRDKSGNLYGSTQAGGTFNNGTVFKLDPTGKETVLYSFVGGQDGITPVGGLVHDNAGTLYGTTYLGGAFGFGTVFRLDAIGKFTVLHSFAGEPTDGASSFAGLILDRAGNLYGTTQAGGASNNGTVFKLDTMTGRETVLHSFAGGATDGRCPEAGLIRDKAGNLYGTTTGGGASDSGTIFKLSPN
ncbi:MAG TPA: choice-of-anchor tandem repeat GloVer-containing protein [Terriglobales bacterium]|nr:choice-of-anchor tandem repeat GloVer-containing protein [Terriglobales bacterium]